MKQKEIKDDIRIRDEMKAMAIAEGMAAPQDQPPAAEIDSQLKIVRESSLPLNPNMMASKGAKAATLVNPNGARRTAYAAN